MKLARCLPILIPDCHLLLATYSESEQSAKDTDGQHLLYESWIHDYRAGPLRGALASSSVKSSL